MEIAVLITCFNRVENTKVCLSSIYLAQVPLGVTFEIFLLDDNSTDNTGNIIKNLFPKVNIIFGTGSLFWAGGMRAIWDYALSKKRYDAYLLLNDDVSLHKTFLLDLLDTHSYCIKHYNQPGIYVGSTIDPETNKITYGGNLIEKSMLKHTLTKVIPRKVPQLCSLANANILLIHSDIVDNIGTFDEKFTHSIADYDYTLTALKRGFKILVAPNTSGACVDDHGSNWLKQTSTLKDRIRFLYSVKGLNFTEYMYYIRKHMPTNVPYYFAALWIKTLFPFIWNKFK